MGGKSSSRQETTNQQATTNIVNDGQFAGAEHVYLDESDRSVTTEIDQDIDNSVTTEIDQDIDNSRSFDDSFNQDHSVTSEFDESFNTDNSITIENDGEFAGNSGTVNILDGGAIEAAKELSLQAVNEVRGVASDAFKLSERAIDNATEQTKYFASSLENITETSLKNGNDTLSKALDNSSELVSDLFDEVTTQNAAFVEGLDAITQSALTQNQAVLSAATQSASDDKKVIAELARNTALGGQDIVAKSSEKMVLFMSVAVGVGFVAMIFTKGAK